MDRSTCKSFHLYHASSFSVLAGLFSRHRKGSTLATVDLRMVRQRADYARASLPPAIQSATYSISDLLLFKPHHQIVLGYLRLTLLGALSLLNAERSIHSRNWNIIMSSVEIRVCGRYRLDSIVKRGDHKTLYLARNVQTNEDVVVKAEDSKARYSNIYTVLQEGKVLQSLQGGIGIPAMHWYRMHNVGAAKRRISTSS